jgi:hypothetical protein
MQVVLLRQVAFAFLVFAMLCAAPLVRAAPGPAGTLTLLEGNAALVRGAARYALAEGVRLQPGDIIEVAADSLAQIEYGDGGALALGAGTRLLTLSASAGKKAHREYYVMQGALKLTGVKQGARFRFGTPIFNVQPVEGAMVLVVSGSDASLFAESGETRLAAGSPTLRLRGGDFYTRRSGQKGWVAALPSKAFVEALPKLFLDPLPARAALYDAHAVDPRRLEEVSYAGVEAWLKAPPAIRKPLVARFEPRASDAAFRAGLIANLKYHPEWDQILNPSAKEVPAADPAPVDAGFERGAAMRLKGTPAP